MSALFQTRMSEKEFDKALSAFTKDFANGGAVRHLADSGLTVKEIQRKLDYPMSESSVGEMVWKHFVNSGVILTEEPGSAPAEKVSYVRELDEFGRASFRRVSEPVTPPEEGYFECDFGLLMHRDRKKYDELLSKLDGTDRDYISGLPWPRSKVWHVMNERMKRISLKLSEGK